MHLLRIRLLGEFSLYHNEEPVTALKAPRQQSLLAYLMLHCGSWQPRLHVASIFWPDSTESQARTNLRQLLHSLRRTLPDADRFLQVDTNSMMWRVDTSVALDVAEFGDLLHQAREDTTVTERMKVLKRAVGVYRGELLPGCYDEWILPERDRLFHSYLRVLHELTGLLEEENDHEAAIQFARRLLEVDPLDERNYRRLMRLYVLTGDRSRALRTYHSGVEILKNDLGVEPEPETRQFYESLLRVDESLQDVSTRATVPLVGRESEWHQLQMAWRTVQAGRPHFLLLSGAAGIGKTRMIEEFNLWAEDRGITPARAHCYPADDRPAYAPIVEWLRLDPYRMVLRELDDSDRAELARLLPELGVEAALSAPSVTRSESWHRQRLFEVLARTLLAGGRPLLLTIDDLQWADGETLAWLQYLFRFNRTTPLLLVGAIRLEDLELSQALSDLCLELRASGHLTDLELGPLNKEQTLLLAHQVSNQRVTDTSGSSLFRQTEGNPLFVIELVRAGFPVLAETALEESEENTSRGETHLRAQLLPPRVEAIIERHLRRLSPPARELAELASVIGREFELKLLSRAGGCPEEKVIEGLHELWRRRIVREQDNEGYVFSHIKIRDVAYAHLPPAQRKLLHQNVAKALEGLNKQHLDSVSGQVGEHYERSGALSQAVIYYRRAAGAAARIHAHSEVVTKLKRVLALLEKMPRTAENLREELQTQVALGSSHTLVKGYSAPEVAHSFGRARELCRRMEGSQDHLMASLWGLHSYHQVRAEFELSQDFAEQFLDLARGRSSPEWRQMANLNLATIRLQRGEFLSAQELLEAVVDGQLPHKAFPPPITLGPDSRVFCRCFLAHALWHLGLADQAIGTIREASTAANEWGGPFEAVVVLLYSAMLHQFEGDPELTKSRSGEAVKLCDEYGYPYYKAWASLLLGWVQVMRGDLKEGVAGIQRGIAAIQATGSRIREPYYLGLLAEARLKQGRVDDGLSTLGRGLAMVEQRGERWCESALHRIKGDLLSAAGEQSQEAERSYGRALQVASEQKARSPELQAAVRLARYWVRQQRKQEACQLLWDKLRWFSANSSKEAVQITAARALLRQLGDPL